MHEEIKCKKSAPSVHNKKMRNPEEIRRAAYLVIGLIGSALALFAVFLRMRDPGSRFKVREADRLKSKGPSPLRLLKGDLGSQKQTRHHKPLLEGHRFDGAPHEILGILPNATEKEIQKAYLELIKRFHPDRIGAPGSREWKDAQSIAAKLNEARNAMLTRLKR
jgi:hypothetical protein